MPLCDKTNAPATINGDYVIAGAPLPRSSARQLLVIAYRLGATGQALGPGGLVVNLKCLYYSSLLLVLKVAAVGGRVLVPAGRHELGRLPGTHRSLSGSRAITRLMNVCPVQKPDRWLVTCSHMPFWRRFDTHSDTVEILL